MLSSPVLYFLVGLLVSCLGTLPFGPINLAVAKITVDYNRLRGLEVALAASLIEMVQAAIALWFGIVITAFLAENVQFRLVVAAGFIGLALFIFFQSNSGAALDNPMAAEKSFFKKGIVIAALNPQAMPFWIFALAAIAQYVAFDYTGAVLMPFIGGVFAGKLLALYGFVVAGDYLKNHVKESGRFINRLLAAILLLIGLGQAWTGLIVLLS